MKARLLQATMIAVIALSATTAFAQNPSAPQSINLSATVNESITISLPLGNTVAFGAVDFDDANPAGPINVQTQWRVRGSRTNLQVCASFADATNAMIGTDDATNAIPASRIQISSATLTNATATGSCSDVAAAPAGSSLVLADYDVSTNRTGTETEVLNFNLALLTAVIPSDDYTGTMTIRAEAVN